MISNASFGRTARRGLVAAGILLLVGIAAGLVADVRAFDQTRGGYEPPYADYTGEPIDWSNVETTPSGMRRAGYVVDVEVDCTSGMIQFAAFGLTVPFRELSPRALVVHKPRQACVHRGFDPEF
jgi:hypothetical protein